MQSFLFGLFRPSLEVSEKKIKMNRPLLDLSSLSQVKTHYFVCILYGRPSPLFMGANCWNEKVISPLSNWHSVPFVSVVLGYIHFTYVKLYIFYVQADVTWMVARYRSSKSFTKPTHFILKSVLTEEIISDRVELCSLSCLTLLPYGPWYYYIYLNRIPLLCCQAAGPRFLSSQKLYYMKEKWGGFHLCNLLQHISSVLHTSSFTTLNIQVRHKWGHAPQVASKRTSSASFTQRDGKLTRKGEVFRGCPSPSCPFFSVVFPLILTLHSRYSY